MPTAYGPAFLLFGVHAAGIILFPCNHKRYESSLVQAWLVDIASFGPSLRQGKGDVVTQIGVEVAISYVGGHVLWIAALADEDGW